MSKSPTFFRDARLPIPKQARPTGRDADPRRTIPLNSAAWQKLRARVLEAEPLCRDCFRRGLITPATDVDHISGDPSDNSLDNLQGLCHECHSIKTMCERHGRPLPGSDVDGLPLDPRHPWNLEKSREADRARPRPQSSSNAKGNFTI